MRTTLRRPITTGLLLVGATFLLTGCGDPGAHLPAGMTGASAAYTTTAGTSDLLGSDPGPVVTSGIGTGVDDPVLAEYDGVDSVGTLTDDPFASATADWNDTMSTYASDVIDDGPLPDPGYGYGYGSGYDDGYGYGGLALASYGGNGGLMSTALSGGWGGVNAFNDAGLLDGGFEDPAIFDEPIETSFDSSFASPGFDDFAPVFDGSTAVDNFDDFVDPGFDAGFVDPGFDAGAGFVDAGIDAGGFVDSGFSGGFDTGVVW